MGDVLKSIEFFSKYGSDVADEMLKQYIGRTLEPEIRAAALQAIDWTGDAGELFDLYESASHPDVQSAIIISADLTEMDDVQREKFNAVFYGSLN